MTLQNVRENACQAIPKPGQPEPKHLITQQGIDAYQAQQGRRPDGGPVRVLENDSAYVVCHVVLLCPSCGSGFSNLGSIDVTSAHQGPTVESLAFTSDNDPLIRRLTEQSERLRRKSETLRSHIDTLSQNVRDLNDQSTQLIGRVLDDTTATARRSASFSAPAFKRSFATSRASANSAKTQDTVD
jgi:hypothetical protein